MRNQDRQTNQRQTKSRERKQRSERENKDDGKQKGKPRCEEVNNHAGKTNVTEEKVGQTRSVKTKIWETTGGGTV